MKHDVISKAMIPRRHLLQKQQMGRQLKIKRLDMWK
jgi:hypothetical protein